MQDDHSQSRGNSNGDNGALPDMTVKEAVKILLQEISDVNKEIRADLGGKIEVLSGRIDKLDIKIDSVKEELSGKIDGLRMEVHQNQTTFMKNFDQLEKRVTVLERKAA